MRRLILDDPFSRVAISSRNLAIFACLVALIGVVLARKGLDSTTALAIEGGAMALALLSILCALAAMVVIWRTGFRGIGLAVGGIALSSVLLAYPTYLAFQARTKPFLPDISTNLDDPPSFLDTGPARDARSRLVLKPMSIGEKDLQSRFYPDFDTLTIDDDPDTVFDEIKKIVRHRHLEVVDEVEPTDRRAGQIDVVVKTLVMGFASDVAIRIRPNGDQTEVDIRSVARTAWQEPGQNAGRVQALIDDIDAAANRG